MITLKTLTIKNFLSIGNIVQTVNLQNDDLILVLGENIDLGGNDNRNGVGKSAIASAISYALFGIALTKIRKDNLINATNQKNMVVTLELEKNGQTYNITRGRKPNIFKFSKEGDTTIEEKVDESQGENSKTQEELERVLGFSHDLFGHLIALNTYVEPFLALRTNDQRVIIEQLLGITKLSEKAERLREEARVIRDEIKDEEAKINATVATNKHIEQNIVALIKKSTTWDSEKTRKIDNLQDSILQLMSVDIDSEIALHKSRKEVDELTSEYKALSRELIVLERDVKESTSTLTRINGVISSFVEKICPTCNQDMDKDTHKKVHDEYLQQQKDAKLRLDEKTIKRNDIKTLATSVQIAIPELPDTFYKTADEAYSHKSTLDTLGNSLENEMMSVNPYTEQIELLKTDGLQEIDYTKINELTVLKDHQEFLLKLLTNKDSFIRKKIIDQNLTYLNSRLAHYLADIGLPHTVKFKSDLEVEIMMLGREFDFDNLSRGERTRLILSLSWAFRDVFESMNDKINLLFLDEIVDQGIDTAGTEHVLKILKEMSRSGGKNIFLISHRDEFSTRVSKVLKVVKENGFTSIEWA